MRSRQCQYHCLGPPRHPWRSQPCSAIPVTQRVRCLTAEYAQGEFAKCMVGVVRGIRFPRVADPKGQPVTFPFQF